jgi:antitoxin HigA-1
MKNRRSTRSPDRCPTHPGALLREIVVPAMPIGKAEFARALGVSRQTIYDILNEKQPVTPQMAIRLGTYFGDGPEIWLNMQRAYDLWHAEREVDVSQITPLKQAS